MYRNTVRALLLASAMLALPATAYAQDNKMAEPPADAVSPDDASLQAVPDSETSVSDADAKMALLAAQLSALQTQMDELKKNQTKATPTWKGAPQWTDEAGWSFKIRGRLQVDGAYMTKPPRYNFLVRQGTVPARTLGFNTRVRRFRIGVEGSMPWGFGYKAEVDYANGAVGFGDVVLSWNKPGSLVSVTLGNQESLDGMEQITSSRWVSFIERNQANDAFINTRRLGLAVGIRNKDNTLRGDVGLFAAHSIDASLDNHGWIGAARVTYTPYVGNGFVHMGLNFQHREFAKNTNGAAQQSTTGAPSAGRLVRYRARPFLQTTDVRYVDTGNFAAKGDDIFGAELYGVFKSLHIGGEAQYTKTRAYKSGVPGNPGDILTGIDAFASSNSQVTPNGNPSFWGGFLEAGYFLTGETRGYKNGLWDRTKVLHPVQDGGKGAWQITGRVDYLNLNSSKLKGVKKNDFNTGLPTGSLIDARGGKQIGYLAGVTWIPMDYVRFLLNYIHTDVSGGPVSRKLGKHGFSTDAIAVRAQVDW
jgi:phosphate-selective porin OprO/OprP